MANLKEIRNRIKSIKSIQKVTSAMKIAPDAKLNDGLMNLYLIKNASRFKLLSLLSSKKFLEFFTYLEISFALLKLMIKIEINVFCIFIKLGLYNSHYI